MRFWILVFVAGCAETAIVPPSDANPREPVRMCTNNMDCAPGELCHHLPFLPGTHPGTCARSYDAGPDATIEEDASQIDAPLEADSPPAVACIGIGRSYTAAEVSFTGCDTGDPLSFLTQLVINCREETRTWALVSVSIACPDGSTERLSFSDTDPTPTERTTSLCASAIGGPAQIYELRYDERLVREGSCVVRW